MAVLPVNQQAMRRKLLAYFFVATIGLFFFSHVWLSRPLLKNRLSKSISHAQIRLFSFKSWLGVEYYSTDADADANLTINCFKSPFVICKTPTQLKDEVKTMMLGNYVKPNNNPSGSEKTLVITTLLDSQYFLSDKEFSFAKCRDRCEFKHRMFLSEASGVIVDAVSAEEKHFPMHRKANQTYILVGLESPVHFYGPLASDENSKYKDQFNLTSTYRVDSDLPMFYSYLCLNEKPKKTVPELEELYLSKNRTAVWFVSNCNTPSERMQYVKELQKYIDVDIYGKCGKSGFENFGTEKDLITARYKFYLSFENSLCKDYVTEKFFKIFNDGTYVIPVVRGGMDYDKYFPPGTFINSANFTSPKHLARFMAHVGGDSKTYIKFLKSRDQYTNIPWDYYHIKRMCRFCEAVHKRRISPPSHYNNIKTWLTKGICHPPNDIVLSQDSSKS